VSKLIIAAICALGILTSTEVRSEAQEKLPIGVMKIVTPFAPGGATDILARYLAPFLREKLGVTVVVESRPGASGALASEFVAKSPADGSVLLLAATHHVINPSLFRSLPYDTRADFSPIAMVATSPNILIVNRDSSMKSVADLLELAKSKPGQLSFGSTGIGGANHLTGELFKRAANIDIMHIPYKGEAPSLNDVIGGHIPMMFATLLTVLPSIEGGSVRALAVASLERSPALPNVPTIDESGLKGFEATSWFGLYMPAAKNNAAYQRIVEAMREILTSEDARAKFPYKGGTPGLLVGKPFEMFVDQEVTKWGDVIKAANVPQE
jgi:tripartite-type tricarboxylate transporter receptor subunit TctC